MRLLQIILLFIIAPVSFACEKPSIPVKVEVKGEVENGTTYYIVAPSTYQEWVIIRATYEDNGISIPINAEGGSSKKYFHVTLNKESLNEKRVFVSYKKESCVHKQGIEFGI